MMTLPPDWREFLSLLISHRVKFLIVGAHALAAHGRPRNTLDLDVLVEPTRANAERLGAVLHEFGFPALAKHCLDFAKTARMAKLGEPPLRIDVMNAIDGVTFQTAWRGRLRRNLDGLKVSFLGRKEFMRNKRAAGRAKDLADLALMAERER